MADDRGNRRLFYHGEKKAVEYREVVQAVRFIEDDFSWTKLISRPPRRPIYDVNPINPGRQRDFGRRENNGWMFVTVIGIYPDPDDIPLANRSHRSSGSGSTGREFRYAARSSPTAKCPSG